MLILTSIVADFDTIKSVVNEKQGKKKKIENLYRDINHPQLFRFNMKKIDDE